MASTPSLGMALGGYSIANPSYGAHVNNFVHTVPRLLWLIQSKSELNTSVADNYEPGFMVAGQTFTIGMRRLFLSMKPMILLQRSISNVAELTERVLCAACRADAVDGEHEVRALGRWLDGGG